MLPMTIKRSWFAVSFWGVNRLGSAFIF